jgi:drug/metabolite transporter (DMT)-like permease
VAGLVAVALTLGSGHVAARLAFANGVNIMTAATLRSACASLLLLALLRQQRIAVWPPSKEFRPTLILGVLVAVQTVLVQLAVALMPVTLAILVFYTYPLFTGAAMTLFGAERLTLSLAAALLAAFAGLAMVLGVGAVPVNPLGVAAGLGASLSFTAALVLTPKLAPTLGAPLRTFFMLTAAAAIFVCAAIATRDFHLPQNHAAWLGLSGLVILYAVGIIGLFLFLPLLGPTRTGVILNMEPVAVALVAWLALGEALAPLQLVGALVVVTAVIFFQVRAHEAARNV